MPKIVIFLGPSLPKDQAAHILDAEYLPPAKRGDIFKAVEDSAEIICLIDGVFFQECSIAHKEVLYALNQGVRVIGASSMGALRAAELDIYGMEGVGKIYQAYKSGKLVSDEEVALIFDPITMEPLSEALINVRYSLQIALDLKIIDLMSHDILFQAATSIYFPERTYERILANCDGLVAKDILDRFKIFIKKSKKDLKMEDAIKAIKRVKQLVRENTKREERGVTGPLILINNSKKEINTMARIKIKDLPKDLKVTREEMKTIMGGVLTIYGRPPGGPIGIIALPPGGGGPIGVITKPPGSGGPVFILSKPPQ